MNARKFAMRLYFVIMECYDILSLLKEIEGQKNVLPLTKLKTQKYLVDYLIIKIHTLFDKTRGVLSFEKIIDYKTLPNNKNFKEEYFKIKKIFSLLIKRIEKNRHQKAHNSKEELLGYSEEEIKYFESTTGNDLKDLLKSEEYQYILYNNLPRDGIIIMLNKLRDLLLYEVIRPEAKRRYIKDIIR